jgi:hypothetical protein
MTLRKDLKFNDLQEVLDDLDGLVRNGYVATKNWDLSQTCEHLADWMTFPIDGFPKSPIVVSVIVGLLRVTRGRALLQKMISEQRMAYNQPTIPKTVYKPTKDFQPSVERLRKAINRLKDHPGFIHPSPLFGPLTHEELVALQLAHCAHHLSLLTPK